MIQVPQLTATLTDAVLVLSELDAIVRPLGTWPEFSLLGRLKLAWKENSISRIMLRLNRLKLSLSLMLDIIQWYVHDYISSSLLGMIFQ